MKRHRSGFAIASMVIGILAVLTAIALVGAVLAIPGIIFARVALDRIKRSPETLRGAGMARAGLICSYVGVVPAFLLLVGVAIPNFIKGRQQSLESHNTSHARTAATDNKPSVDSHILPSVSPPHDAATVSDPSANGHVIDPLKEPEVFEELAEIFLKEKNYLEAYEMLVEIASLGNAKAQFQLGNLYHSGQGVQQSHSEAAKWYARAVRRGYLPAFSPLAEMYRRGHGVAKNEAETVRLSRIAADRGNASAQVQLGLSYRFGYGVPKDEQAGEQWHRRGAEQGDLRGQYLMANIFRIYWFDLLKAGNGTKSQLAEFSTEGDKWAILAVSQGYEDSHHYVDWLVRNHPLPPKSNTNAWAEMSQEWRELAHESVRRANAFVPRKETTNEWITGTAPGVGLGEPTSSGTGFFITEDGYIMTNFHVVEDAMRIIVRCGRETYLATLEKVDQRNDLALLKITGRFRTLSIGPSLGSKLGDAVLTVGFPNLQLQGAEPKFTDGRISSLAGARDDVRHFQISVAIQPGNSGGALVNSIGNVVGIVTARLSEKSALETYGALPQNVNYAIKSSYVLSLLESVPELASKLKKPSAAKERKYEDVVQDTQAATVLILVY